MKEKRIDKILQMLKLNSAVGTAELSKILDVAESTVRRDLNQLEKIGLLKKVHGGAVKLENQVIFEMSYSEREELNLKLKEQTAKKAAEYINDNDTIFIGPGTTTEMLLKYIKTKNNIIITNSLSAFSKYSSLPYKLIITPGYLRTETSAVIGTFTNNFLKKINVDIAFSGANCIYESQLMSSNEEEGTAQEIILNNAKKRYLLLDSTKFETKSFFTFYSAENLDAIITDNQINSKIKTKYKKICKII
jgi:DeoR family lactose phosphotransferase system repressor